jgi:hypothetical protein
LSRVDIQFQIAIPELVVPSSPPSLNNPTDGATAPDSSNHVLSQLAPRSKHSIHVFLMSSRSYDRYEEAIVMLKSMFIHHDPSAGAAAAAMAAGNGTSRASAPPALHLHIVTDAAGKSVLGRYLHDTLRLGWVAVSFYDYAATCERMTDDFLRSFGFSISAHYSGKAGYCRLFVPQILNAHADTMGTVEYVIAIETDQLFFRDIQVYISSFCSPL